MADFSKAWQITASWEGLWTSKPEKGSEQEEYVYNSFWGTNFGLTGRYCKEFAGFTASQRAFFQKMGYNEAGAVWQRTRWAWMQGANIQNQEIANLLFDWGVRRWNSLVKGVSEVLGVPVTAITMITKMSKIGGIPKNPNDGFYQFTGALANLINKHPNPSVLHEQLKAKRKALDNPRTPSIINRYDSFQFLGTQPKTGGYAHKRITRDWLDSRRKNSNWLPLVAIVAGTYFFKRA